MGSSTAPNGAEVEWITSNLVALLKADRLRDAPDKLPGGAEGDDLSGLVYVAIWQALRPRIP